MLMRQGGINFSAIAAASDTLRGVESSRHRNAPAPTGARASPPLAVPRLGLIRDGRCPGLRRLYFRPLSSHTESMESGPAPRKNSAAGAAINIMSIRVWV